MCILKFCQFHHKLMMTLFIENDDIITDVKSSWIHLLNYYCQLHAQPFSYLDILTGPVLQFMALTLCYRKQVVLFV